MPFAPALGVTMKVTSVNVAVTAQSAVTGLSVNVFPVRTPAHVPPTENEYPGCGVIVKEVVSPAASVNGALGLIDPLGPALGVMVRKLRERRDDRAVE